MITAQNSAQIFASGVGTSYIQQKLLSMHLNRPFHGFRSILLMNKLGKIRRLRWKEHFKIRNLTKLENDLLKTNNDIASKSP